MSDFKIGRRELYILPTRMGWYFGLIMAALFGIAVKFDNQAAFMMLFVLISVALIGMIYTHNNVIGLSLSGRSSNAVFLGEHAEFPLTIQNDGNKERHAVWVVSGGYHQVMELSPHSQQQLKLKLPTVQRGFLNCDPISLTSIYPIGIFFCWTKRFISQKRCLVYPQPLDLVPLPFDSSQSGKQENRSAARAGNDDFSGMKQYQPGDKIRDIHWPSVAKTNKLVTIDYETLSPSSINLSWSDLPPNMSIEDKLSQLCFWVVESEKADTRYQLEMPSHTIAYDTGAAHYHACLRTLALWGLDEKKSVKKTSATKPKTKRLLARLKPSKRGLEGS